MGTLLLHRGAGLLVCLAVLLGIAPSGALSQPGDAPARPVSGSKRVLHLKLRGDLDCGKLARDVAAELAQAKADGVGFLLLELDGNRWRADVVWTIAQEVRGLGVPVAVWLNDLRDKQIGTGQAMLAILATAPPIAASTAADAPLPPPAIFVGARSVIALDAGDDLRADAPDGTDWETIDREIQGAAWQALRLRAVETELAAALLSPTENAWAIVEPSTGRPRLTIERPPLDVAATPVVERATALAPARVRLESELAIDLGMAAGTARTPGDILAALRITAAPRRTREVTSGLADARRRVDGAVAEIDRALERADRTLRDLPRRSEPDYETKRERAGRAALPILDEAAAAIVRAEELIADYPELLRANPPSRTPVGQDPEMFRNAWRLLFQQRRDDFSLLASRARDYAGR